MSNELIPRLLNNLRRLQFQLDGIKLRMKEAAENPDHYKERHKIGLIMDFEYTLDKMQSTATKLRNTGKHDQNLLDYVNAHESYIKEERDNFASLKEKHSSPTQH
jgi:hypothetical protein